MVLAVSGVRRQVRTGYAGTFESFPAASWVSYRSVMTVLPDGAATPARAAHLDDDAEALEDPVHCGDALHQHELHRRHDEAALAADEPVADGPEPRAG